MTNPEIVPRRILELAIEALRVNDERLIAKAFDLCEAIGAPIQGPLIRTLACGKCQSRHRARLLQAIGRTGAITDPGDWFDLVLIMSRDKNAMVRAEAMRFMADMPMRQRQILHQETATPA